MMVITFYMTDFNAFALTGRDCSNTRYPGCRFACPGLCARWAFSPFGSSLFILHSTFYIQKIPGRREVCRGFFMKVVVLSFLYQILVTDAFVVYNSADCFCKHVGN